MCIFSPFVLSFLGLPWSPLASLPRYTDLLKAPWPCPPSSKHLLIYPSDGHRPFKLSNFPSGPFPAPPCPTPEPALLPFHHPSASLSPSLQISDLLHPLQWHWGSPLLPSPRSIMSRRHYDLLKGFPVSHSSSLQPFLLITVLRGGGFGNPWREKETKSPITPLL